MGKSTWRRIACFILCAAASLCTPGLLNERTINLSRYEGISTCLAFLRYWGLGLFDFVLTVVGVVILLSFLGIGQSDKGDADAAGGADALLLVSTAAATAICIFVLSSSGPIRLP